MTAVEAVDRAVEVGWLEFQRITRCETGPLSGRYEPSRGAFDFACRAAFAELAGVLVGIEPGQ